MREWLSGGVQPCQGWGRGFDPRLALFLFGGRMPAVMRESGFFVSQKRVSVILFLLHFL